MVAVVAALGLLVYGCGTAAESSSTARNANPESAPPLTGADALGLAYGPFIGIAGCPGASSNHCAAIGFDMVLEQRAATAWAWIAGQSVRLRTPGPVPHDADARGRDWGGYLSAVDLERKDSPFYLPVNGRSPRFWAGDPPVYLPVRILLTRPDGRRVVATLPRVRLSPGFG